MDLETYRADATTVPWTMEVKPKRIIEEIPIREAVHSLLGRTMLMGGRGKYFDREMVERLSGNDWESLQRKASEIESYLQRRSNQTPAGEDVRRVFSQVHHMWSKDDPIGLEAREALAKALVVLGVGDVLPSMDVLPHKKDKGVEPPARG